MKFDFSCSKIGHGMRRNVTDFEFRRNNFEDASTKVREK